MQCKPLKHRFFNLSQLAFWAGQETENECAVPGDNLKHRFLDLNQLVFWAGQRLKNFSKCHESTWNIVVSTLYK